MSSGLILVINFGALLVLLLNFSIKNALSSVDASVIWHSMIFTLEQAFISSLLSVVLGLICAPGYARAGRYRRLLRWPLIFPNMMSPVLAVLSLLVSFRQFPFGFWGIIIGHLFLNTGLCTVWIGERWLELEGRWGPVNQVMGGGVWPFYRKILFPLVIPQIKNTFAVVFSLCLASFAIPLVLGGGPQNSTLEVLIFERIHAGADLTSAIVLGLLQCFLQFVVFIAILKPMLLKTEFCRLNWTQRFLSPWNIPVLLLMIFNLTPLYRLIETARPQWQLFGLVASADLASSVHLSVFVALGVSVCAFGLLGLLTAWGWVKNLIHVPALSGVAVGVAWFLFFKTWKLHLSLALVCALIWGHLNVIFLPVFRLCAPALTSLRERFEKPLKQLGASRVLGFEKVYLKMGTKTYVAGAVLAGCWSMGEFSVSKLMGGQTPTLPVYIQNLMSSYRLELAAASSLGLLLLSVVSMTLFEVLADGMG